MLESLEDDLPLCCTQCSHRTVWPFQLEHHIHRNHKNDVLYAAGLFHAVVEPEQYFCASCCFKTHNKVGGYKHCVNQHAGSIDGSEKSQSCEEFEMFLCEHCKNRSHSILSFRKHHDSCKVKQKTRRTGAVALATAIIETENKIQSEDGIRYFCCSYCSYKNKRKQELKRHNMVNHAAAGEIEWFHCTQCSYRARAKKYLNEHTLIHAPIEEIDWFYCGECSYRARKRCTLKNHLLTHAAADEIVWTHCSECSYRCKLKKQLKRHMLTHAAVEEVDWVQCTECSYQTKHKRYLKTHMLKHATDEEANWFHCTECSYRAKDKRNLKLHVITHVSADDINWFHCTTCSYRAKRKGYLRRHVCPPNPCRS